MNLDIYFNDDIYDRLLLNCVKAKDHEVIEILLSHQKDINSTSCTSSVCYAVNNGDEETVKLFLNKGFDTNNKDEKGFIALHYAVLSNNNNIIQLLLDNNSNVKLCDPYLLLHAVKSNRSDIVASLLKHGMNANIVNDEGYTALHYSIENNKLDITKLLLDNGANIEIINKYSFINNIIKSRFANYTNMIELLLEYGADVNNINEYYAPIHLAVDNENESIIKLLISYGADINIRDDYNSSSPLHHAIKSINGNILKILLDNGADVNSINRYGRTPIYYAIYDKNLDFVNTLLDYGADVNIVDLSNNTPLTVANNSYIKKLIISHIIISKYINKFVEYSSAYKRNIDFIHSHQNLIDIKLDCENEIMKLRNTKIGCKNLLECFINNDMNTVYKAINNETINNVSTLFNDYRKEFPIYNSVIKNFISESIRRHELLTEFRNKITNSIPGFKDKFPQEIQYIILENLSNNDLEKILVEKRCT
ncbi:SWPV2-ORF013 [Shearwaterpox virus]|uniref:SWPV2-ORF013 n=1 Tax=Shearwaterpox virus TaxID=1974596 RepID=A0A1V0QFX8_CNPV|nr:SWPV2-ORF013 [Shearwaterpox virus]QRM15293.1 ankyrin repeat protein [Mudlarkpox virus]QRM15646.1 ankyrin repeat protein [Penguinpox virus 2]QRM15976.1 ankyrin repeat protein [Albatrosspox virus]